MKQHKKLSEKAYNYSKENEDSRTSVRLDYKNASVELLVKKQGEERVNVILQKESLEEPSDLPKQHSCPDETKNSKTQLIITVSVTYQSNKNP